MKLKIHLIKYTLFFLAMAIIIASCNNAKNYERYINEKYVDEKFDSSLMRAVLKYKNILLKRFNVTSIEKNKHQCYHLLFFSSHGYGQSIKFEKKDSAFYVNSTCYSTNPNYQDCTNVETKITLAD